MHADCFFQRVCSSAQLAGVSQEMLKSHSFPGLPEVASTKASGNLGCPSVLSRSIYQSLFTHNEQNKTKQKTHTQEKEELVIRT